MKKTYTIAGNWKMNTLSNEATDLAQSIRQQSANSNSNIILIPPFIHIPEIVRIAEKSRVHVGAQNCHYEKKGAYTGEISAEMIAESGCAYVLAGHSERRQYFGETDEIVALKTAAILESGMKPIVCIGETLNERQEGSTLDVIARQFRAFASHIENSLFYKIIIAYEPVWAIGTGLAATHQQAQEVHGFIRNLIISANPIAYIPILYGGSVTDANAAELFAQPDIDGALIGGASLKSDVFCRIISIADNINKELS